MATTPMTRHNIEPLGSPISMNSGWLYSRNRDTAGANHHRLDHIHVSLGAPQRELPLNENRKVSWKGHDAGLAPVGDLLPAGLIEPATYIYMMPVESAWPAAKAFENSHCDHPGLASQHEFPFTYSSAPSSSASLGNSPQSASFQSSLIPISTSSDTKSSPATTTTISSSTSNIGAIPCRSCSKTFCDTSTRNRHEKLHRPKSFDIACSSCGETFGRNDACLKHIRNLHAGATEGVHPVKISVLA